jgi:hypothetical protein
VKLLYIVELSTATKEEAMKIKLRYGYMDIEDVEAEDKENRKGLHVMTTIYENEFGEVYVFISSEWRFEIKKYVERWIPDFKEMADTIISENIVQS